MTSSRIIGPALAGLLVTTVGFGWAFLVDGLSYIAVLVGLWHDAHLRAATRRRSRRRAKGQVREGLRYARSVPELWVPLVMMAVVGTLAFNFQTVFPLFVTRDLGGTDTTFTVLFSVVSVGALVGALATRPPQAIGVRIGGAGVAGLRRVAGRSWRSRPNLPVAFPVGVLVGLRQHRLPDRVDGDRADAGRPDDAGPGAGPAGDGVPRRPTHRRADRRLGLREFGARWGIVLGAAVVPRRRRLGPGDGAAVQAPDPLARPEARRGVGIETVYELGGAGASLGEFAPGATSHRSGGRTGRGGDRPGSLELEPIWRRRSTTSSGIPGAWAPGVKVTGPWRPVHGNEPWVRWRSHHTGERGSRPTLMPSNGDMP